MIRYDRSSDFPVATEMWPLGASHTQWYRCVFLVLVALFTYTHVPLTSGGRLLVPSFPTVAIAPLIFLAVREDITAVDVVFMLKIGFVLLLSIALSPGYAVMDEKFLGLVQFWMAVAVAMLIVRLMQQLEPVMLARSLLCLWCLILFGSILEVTGVIQEVSDSFREWAFRESYTIYDADLRDVSLVGWSRPKLFSSEPSHVTKAFIASINAWLLIRVSWSKAVVVTVATLAMLIIMGSPMLLVSAAMTMLILVWDRAANLGQRVVIALSAILMGLFLGAYFGGDAYSTAASRISSVGTIADSAGSRPSSEERRMVFPYLTLVATLSRSPVFGAGVGGKEVVAQLDNLPAEDAARAIGNNALAEVGIFLGIVGGVCLIYLVLVQARRTGVQRMLLFVALVVLFSQLMGGLDTFRYWGYIGIVWGALAYADRIATSTVETSSPVVT